MARPPKLTDHELAQLRALHAQGMTRNDIARQLGRAPATISTYAAAQGLSFDRSRIEAATEARKADFRARRAELSDQLLTRAAEFLRQMDEPHLTFKIGGRDNVYTEHILDRPPVEALRNLVLSAAIAIDKHAVLEKIDSDTGSDAAGSLLGALFAQLQARHGDSPGA